jgi:hypothetical protein
MVGDVCRGRKMNAPRRSVRCKACPCGSVALKVVYDRVAEDCVETMIECKMCGRTSEPVEYPYGDPESAADVWNRGRIVEPMA